MQTGLDFCNQESLSVWSPTLYLLATVAGNTLWWLTSEVRSRKICDLEAWRSGLGWKDHMAWRFVCFPSSTIRAKEKQESEARKREGKHNKEKHKRKMQKTKCLYSNEQSDLRKGIGMCLLLWSPSPSGLCSLHFVVCPVFLTQLHFLRVEHK